jgi:hypothetical protein
MRAGLGHVLPEELDAAVALGHVAQQGADERALAHPVAAQQAQGLAARDLQVNAVQHMAGAVPGVDAAGFEDGVLHGGWGHVQCPPK